MASLFSRRTPRLLAASVVTAAALVLAAVPGAYAQPPAAHAPAPSHATVEVMVLHATQQAGAGSIDPQIGNLPQLKKPPFSAYNTYKLLDRKAIGLDKGKPATYGMVNKRTLQITLEDVTADHRYRVAAAINQPGGSAYLKLLEVTATANETFFVAGQSYQGGILVIGFTMKP